MIALDTNVLIYAHDPRDPRKQRIATDLIASQRDAVLLWQVACEYVAASRKLSSFGYSFELACEDIRELMEIWSTATPSWAAFERARSLVRRRQLSFWDALITSASAECGVSLIYSEDFASQSPIDGIEIVNPFAASSAD